MDLIYNFLIRFLHKLRPIIQVKVMLFLKVVLYDLFSQFSTIQIMNLGSRAPLKPEIRILERRTESDGRALYRIEWVGKNDLPVWEPLNKLKDFYHQIEKFQKEYEQKQVDWSNVSISQPKEQQKPKNDTLDRYLQSIMSRKKNDQPSALYKINKNQHTEKNNQEGIELSKYKNIGSLSESPIGRTTISDMQKQSNQRMMQQGDSLRDAQNSEPGESADFSRSMENGQNLNQQDSEMERIAMASGISLAWEDRIKLLRKNPPKSSQKIAQYKFKKRKKQPKPDQKETTIAKILEIYREGSDWWAHVLTDQNRQEHILRDWLRMNEPRLLLSFYESSYMNRKIHDCNDLE